MQVKTKETKHVLELNETETHVIFDGDVYELIEDQTGDYYFVYPCLKKNNIIYVEPIGEFVKEVEL